MRHIPEDELHAYLDQALSRSQCIEIEKHLARCGPCAESRDTIAALRDRTTALLDRVAPLPSRPPPFEVLLGRAVVRRERPLRRYGLWAASLAGAVIAGWALRAAVVPPSPRILAVADQPAAAPADPVELAMTEPEPVPARVEGAPLPPLAPDPTRFSETEVRLAGGGPRAPEPEPVTPASPVITEVGRRLALDAAWSPITLPEAEDLTGRLVPMVPDLPVAEIRFRRAAAAERPLLVVAQRHPTAGLIHTLEGPVSDLADLVAAQLRPESDLRSSDPSRSLPDYVEGTAGIRRTSRALVVVGRLPTDSLNVLAQTVVMR